MRIIISLLIVLLLNGCATTGKSNSLAQVVKDYYEVYSKREDFNKFMAYYADNAKFQDIIYGNSYNNKAEIRSFLDWGKGDFKVLNGTRTLTVTRHVFGKNTVITEGFFHAFSYDGQKLGPWLFIITQKFDSKNKIIEQTDWINYTPRNNFLGGKNMNDALLKK
ncbi:nuclear transport factor 2 family protein [Thalassotalea sp. PLHSN55]|uniref:nuclear transport factor 2 family protein n=1 Tax=Thalassotalea sp. PLHSN55 TaxID=3435888 RepID=UPI003F867D4D